MTGYDFDKTIYRGDSYARFFLFCLTRYPWVALLLPYQLTVLLLYGLRALNRRRAKQAFALYLRLVPAARAVRRFWDREMRRIQPWFQTAKRSDDVIVTASPSFLVGEAARRLEIACIATELDLRTLRIRGENCYGAEKVARFDAAYGENAVLSAFYSDSFSDLPLMRRAERGVLVRRGGFFPVEREEGLSVGAVDRNR